MDDQNEWTQKRLLRIYFGYYEREKTEAGPALTDAPGGPNDGVHFTLPGVAIAELANAFRRGGHVVTRRSRAHAPDPYVTSFARGLHRIRDSLVNGLLRTQSPRRTAGDLSQHAYEE